MQFPSIQELKRCRFDGLEADAEKPFYEAVKRVCDLVFSAATLVFFSPFWLLIVVLIRLDSKGKALFAHTRIGKNGKPFTLYKFRTMYQGVKNQELSPESPNDGRITKIGRFLRRTSLDEVPQLFNILKGDMSLVGPRPEMPFIVEHYTAMEKKRLLVKPGLTGIWQIMGRKDLPLHHNIEFDFYYIRHRSLLLDLVIIIKTIGVVISGKGAY
jgi:lipopolysaccharide/colanic/teichoic acid biosynthesis glycosyltransferase